MSKKTFTCRLGWSNVRKKRICLALQRMRQKRPINNLVRRKLREMRLARGLGVKEIASRLGLPYSSYSCMENGFYNISLENLYCILGVLEADINEVWPVELIGPSALNHALYLKRKQEFRLAEVVSLTQAEGAALFFVRSGKCRVLIYQNLSDFLLDRLNFYLEDGRPYPEGLWFHISKEGAVFHLFLKAERCPDYLRKLVEHYLIVWSNVFTYEIKDGDSTSRL